MREQEKIYGMLLYEVEQFLVNPKREQEYIEIFKSTYIEDQRIARDEWPRDMPRFDYEPTPWKMEVSTAVDREVAQMLMIVPKEIEELHQKELQEQEKDVKDQVKIEDTRSQLPIGKVYHFFQEYERLFIAEPEPMQLIMGIANNDDEVWTLYKEELQRVNIVKKDTALQVYKSVQGLINLKRTTKEYKVKRTKATEGKSVEPPDLKPILNSLTSGLALDPILVEDLVMLAQGNLEEAHFVNLTNRFNLPPQLVQTFFLSAFLH